MTPERYQQVNRLLDAALERTPEERTAFLIEACEGDEELLREVESLLTACEGAGSFIEAPPAEAMAKALGEGRGQTVIGRTLGHYEVRALIGAGGMGEVYQARDVRLDREVAIKIIPPQLAEDREALRRFEREAKAIASLSHPNVCAIYDFGSEQGITYAVMELLAGESLRTRLARSALNWREAVGVGIVVAEGLAAAHAKGIVHRDLKPENIFLTSSGQAKVLDFGIARVKHAVSPEAETEASSVTETTKPGAVIGTIGYMSPEQVRGESVEAASDIFSLGCVLYEMVSGRRAFARATTAETIAAILKEEPPALAAAGREIPQQVERVIRHCLEKQPGERYESTRELASDLAALQSPSKTHRLAPAVSLPRLRFIWWVGAAVAILLLGIAAWWYLMSMSEPAIESLAILPLANASGDAEIEYLSDGITESIINYLSQLPKLRVMARSTVFRYKGKQVDPRQVGQELNVKAVFTGKMLQHGETLSIQADLVNAVDGSQLWGERYDRRLADLLTVQEEMAKQISEKLRLRLSGAEQRRLAKHYTDNIEAHQLYLQGRYYLNKHDEKGLKQSIELFKQAIDLDPNYALAYVGLADAYYFLSNLYLPPKEAMPRSQAAAMKALELEESLGEAHAALAVVKVFYDWDWAEGERAFKRALALNPGQASIHNLYGVFLVQMKRFEEAQVEMNRAHDLDPLSPYIHVGMAWPALFSRRYDEAIQQLRGIIALNPEFSNGYLNLAWAYAQKGMYEEAVTAFNKAKSLDNAWFTMAYLGNTYAMAGKRDEALKALTELQERAAREHVSGYGFALIYAGLGDADRAFAALQKAYEARDEVMLQLNVDPAIDGLRSDPRFADLLRRMGLAP
jgi:serine/threonine-protein kinase